MNNKQKQIHTIDTVFPLIFILLFGFCALALVLSGAHVYQDTTDGLKQNYTIRTAATYLQEKVREYSSESQVEVLSQKKGVMLSGAAGRNLFQQIHFLLRSKRRICCR